MLLFCSWVTDFELPITHNYQKVRSEVIQVLFVPILHFTHKEEMKVFLCVFVVIWALLGVVGSEEVLYDLHALSNFPYLTKKKMQKF